MAGHLDGESRRGGVGTVLQSLRLVLGSFVVALLLIGLVTLMVVDSIDDGDGGLSTGVAAAGIVAFGVASLLLVRVVEPRLDCTSDGSLLGTYRTRFFLRLAMAEAVALLGFVAVFLTGDAWLYPFGGAFTTVGFLRAAPTERNLERDEETLNEQGCGRSLRELLEWRPGSA
ncbi:MAG: hypothetical protein ACSLFP_09145 [Acidimicrobiales bacterium]